MPAGVMSQPRLISASLPKSIFSSPSLSLALVSRDAAMISLFFLILKGFCSSQTNLEGGVSGAHDEMLRHIAGVGDFDAQSGGDFISHAGFAGKSNGTQREDENESRSGSDNVDGGSGDDNDLDHPPKKKRYHRHTPWQIQELEACALSL